MLTTGLEIQAAEPVRRTVYDFKKADWPALRRQRLEADWRSALAGSGDEATNAMVRVILYAVSLKIPSSEITDKVWTHPWLNDACRKALQRKRDAFGTPLFEQRRDECSRTYLEAFNAFVAKTCAKPI